MSLTLDQEPDARPSADWLLPLAQGELHEVYAAREADGAGLCALALLLGGAGRQRFRLWVRHEAQIREAGAPYPAGVAALGLDPADLLLVRARDVACALQAGLEGARCTGLRAVIIELRGEAKAYDLTASRRLALAARASGVPVLMVRAAATPTPSAAQMRWQMRALSSRALAAKAPGPPAFELTLLRARNGQEGLRYFLEWDRDACQFIPRSLPEPDPASRRPAPLSGAVVPIPVDQPGPAGAGASHLWRRAG